MEKPRNSRLLRAHQFGLGHSRGRALERIGQSPIAKILYGSVFVVLLPAALALWAHGTRNVIQLPALHSALWGAVLVATGVAVMSVGMIALWIRGGGLPMNAFPPPRFVANGIYGLVPHPIYGGFVIGCAGVSILVGSASGLWLMTPSVALASSALVLGYELPDLRRRFGAQLSSPWLPADGTAEASLLERVRVYFVVLLPWLVAFESVSRMGAPPDAVTTYMSFETHLPVVEWTEVVYASTYPVVLLAPMLVRSGRALRQFARRGLVAMALVFPLYLLLPFDAPPRPFDPTTPLGGLLLWERTPYSGVAACPSFHVVWALIAASALSEGARWKRWAWGAWAAFVAVSCVTTGMHSVADVLAGFAAYLVVIYIRDIWEALLNGAERIANSWREWRIGPARIINHGAYAGAATLVGMWLIDAMLGPGHAWLIISVYLASTVGAALWAQWVEGSPALLRPLGFYGGMIGAVIGATVAPLTGLSLWTVLAAICVAAPWIQALGRLRCLVQGCCHGRATETVPGIRYTHPRSRVCRLAHLEGVPVHATPLYSILWNGVVAAAVLRLAQLHSPCSLICGIYLILSGIGRFVEEAYRGEPQTLIFRGLRLYQWVAIATVVAGAAITTVHSAALPSVPTLRITSFLLGLGCGLAAWFVTGVDFPESSRRFARLT